MFLSDLNIGQSAVIKSVGGEASLRRHILDMGLTPGTVLKLVKKAPMGDPLEFQIRGYELTLRLADAKRIEIAPAENSAAPSNSAVQAEDTRHPQLGEFGIYHVKQSGDEIPEGQRITFALAGNQNTGKTTLFNQLTGAKQHVGNFPGVTVDRKDGAIRGHENTLVTDLPGIYSLSPYTSEELVTRDFLMKEKPDCIINIVDATNIERNLYLTMQLIELNIPMVLALNMMDEVRENGGTILVNRLEEALGIPVVPVSASSGEGVGEAVRHALHVARFRERPGRLDFCDADGPDGGAVHRCIHGVVHLIEDHAKRCGLPLRFAATKLVEGDMPVMEQLKLDDNEKEMLEHIIVEMENETGIDRYAAMADMRFDFIEKVCGAAVVKPVENLARARSLRFDKVLTGKYTALPAFFVIMGLVFWLTFGVFGAALSERFEALIARTTALCASALTAYGLNPVVKSLIIDGVFAGVGSVLSFLPVIVILFLFLSIIEDTGYMARVAFVMDRPLRKIGLSGRSFVPMLIGFGCSVPAIMAARTLPSERDRKMTIFLTPFMSCSAKLPIYALFTAAFFPRMQGTCVMIGLYLLGVASGVLFALIMKSSVFTGHPVPFVMELPNYRFPNAKTVALLIWEKAKDFLTKAFTVIFFAAIIIWFLQTFDSRLNVVADSSQSLLALAGGLIAPVFKPLVGASDWRISTALITGLMAKESVVSSLTVLLGGNVFAIKEMFTTKTALVFLSFTLLYTPCVAAVATVKRELGARPAWIFAAGQCLIAWIVAFAVKLLLGAFGM
ncbi:MAG: ferrous iron transport protein B [Synergistaceae bacterium]|nr:ferrous iron transport protein B [Synergistaceae bacterium]